MAGSAKATIDHDEIRRWVEERGGCPSHVKRTGDKNDPGILRIDFPGYSGQKTLAPIGWDEFFDWFEKNNLAFLHQDEKGGKTSRFCKLVSRNSVEVEAPRRQPSRGRGRRREERVEMQPAAPQKGRQTEARGDGQMQKRAGVDVIQLIRQQHDMVRDLFGRMETDDVVADDVIDNVAIHLMIEEGVLYPALLETELAERTYENITEHLGVKRLIADLIEGASDPEIRVAQLNVLRRLVEEHMDEEEEIMLPVMAQIFDDEQRRALAQEMMAFMAELTEETEDGALESVLSTSEVPTVM